MRLPFVDQAYVPRDKMVQYLLSTSHPQGRYKVLFFRALGFSASEPEAFAFALCEHARNEPVIRSVDSKYGTVYVVEGILKGPVANAMARSVWIVERGSSRPRLVTTFPAPLRWRTGS